MILIIIFMLLDKKKIRLLILISLLIFTLNYSSNNLNGDFAMFGRIINKRGNSYTILSNKIYNNSEWKNHRDYYYFYYSKFSVEEISNGKKVFIKGYSNKTNYLDVSYIAPYYNKSLLETKDVFIKRIEKNLDSFIVKDVLISSIMGGVINKDIFKNTGTLHLFAVSGMHVFIIYYFLSFLIKNIIYKRNLRLIIPSIIISFYPILTGFSSSSIRAILLLLFMNFFKILDINVKSFNILGLIGILNFLFIPETITNPGFQMSYAATFLILYTINKIKNDKITPFFIPLSAFIGVFPFIMIHFGETSFVGLLITPLLTPMLITIMFLAFLLIVFSFNLLTSLATFIVVSTLSFLSKFENIPLLITENIFFVLLIWSVIFIIYIYLLEIISKKMSVFNMS